MELVGVSHKNEALSATHTLGLRFADLMLNVEYRSIPAFRANPRHARKHPKKQVARLARGIEEHGFNVPVLIDKAGMILAGHARVEAARQARLESVPVIVISHLSETEARAFVLFDNRIAEGGEWRRDVLALEFEALLEVDADLALTGFELPEIDVVLDEARESGADEGNVGPAPGRLSPAGATSGFWERTASCAARRSRGATT